MRREPVDPDGESEDSKSTNQDLDADFEGLERRKILAGRAYQQGTQFIGIDLILSGIGLPQYVDDFVHAGEDMLEAYAFRSDEEVDSILRNVQQLSGTRFPFHHRCAIWKALRFDWFRSPESVKEFIDRTQIPLLVLPKKDFRARDNMIDMKSLDSERQRMVKRRTTLDEVEGVTVVQDEIYKRTPHIFTELQGLERSVEYWMTQDPRKMARVDPKEEVLFNQLKASELQIASMMDNLKSSKHIKMIVTRFFLLVRVLYALLTVLFVVVAIIQARSSQIPGFLAFSSEPYLRLSALYLCTFWFVTEATRNKRHGVSGTNLDTARNMHEKCRLLNSDLISFRLKTHYLRQAQIPRFLDDPNSKPEDDEIAAELVKFNPSMSNVAGLLDERLDLVPKPNLRAASTRKSQLTQSGSVLSKRKDRNEFIPVGSVRSLTGGFSDQNQDADAPPPALVPASESRGDAEEESWPSDMFHFPRRQEFQEQLDDEANLVNSLIYNLSSDPNTAEVEDLSEGEALGLANLEKQLTRN
jgi:hypothetical protein